MGAGEAQTLKIYVYGLTHGGGLRHENEYRIQVHVRRFEEASDYKTLVLGWQEELNVFAGFDVRKHRGNLGYSSSIQMRRESLERAVLNGVATHDKGNNEIVISFLPDFFMDYVTNLEALHSFGESERDIEVLEAAIEEGANEEKAFNDEAINEASQPRRETVADTRRKVRQSSFNRRVLTAYGYQCAFCSIQLKLIDAAHIIPVKTPYSTDRTSNGIVICPLHHRAYDNSLITFNEKYETLRNEKKLAYLRHIGQDGGMERFLDALRPMIHVPPAVSDRPHVDYVIEANKLRGWNFE